ncbi:MAG: formylglycine-generating enzyme family protein [Gammaproteobacteria bacterium]|nr:formylglycine-generating enzyme family protein [Gammaproteobacteria bacterium]
MIAVKIPSRVDAKSDFRMAMNRRHKIELNPKEQQKRKRYLVATLTTCVALAMIFGVAHVVKLGANRMNEMRSKAGYDLKDMNQHIRAAGEDIQRHRLHEMQKGAGETYELTEIQSMLADAQWQEIDTMVKVPAGEFIMGTNYERADAQDQPEHTIELSAFYIDKYPVTNAQYARFVMQTNHRPPLDWENGKIPDGKLLHPVTMVSWYDAKAYCEANDKRLPTEAEWEKAARGNDGNRWPWGNKMDTSRVNTYYNVGSTTEVTKYAGGVSPYGVFDLAGNVSEWTASDFNPYTDSDAPSILFQPKQVKAQTPQDRSLKVADLVPVQGVTYKVRRGGSWKSDPFATSAYHRNYSLPHYASDFFGFRCAKDFKQKH